MKTNVPLRPLLALAAALLLPAAALALTPTPSTTEGPYYPFNSGQTLSTAWLTGEAADNDLTHIYSTSAQSKGTVMLLSGTLVDSNGTAISGAKIELWEADNGGIYYYVASTNNYSSRDTTFQPYGTATTDSSGAWSFRCIKPGLYTGRIRHFHYKVNVNGSTKLTSQFMFTEDSASFSGDNVAAPLVTAGTMSLTTLTPTSGTDSSGNSVLIATKQIVLSGTYASTDTGTAPTISTQPSPAAIATGEAATFTVVATGTGTLSYQWRKDGTALSGATAASYTVASASTAATGSYTVVVTNTSGSTTATTTSSAAPLLVTTTATAASTSALINLSTRGYLQSSSSVIIAGFVIQSADGKKVLVRAVGPTLTTLGVTGAAADPSLEIYNASGTKVATNDTWDSSLSNTFASLGAFALASGSKDAALTVDLPNGTGTAQVRGTAAGVALVEAYDTASSTTSRLVNLSARSFVGTDSNVLVAGFVLNGTGGKRLLLRGIGPRLADLGVSGVLADPKLEIYNAASVKIAENDNWSSTLATTFTTLGAFALTTGSKDAALLVTLPAGASYTAILTGTGSTTGEALLELYEVP